MKHWFAFCSTAALATILATNITSCGKQENTPTTQKGADAAPKEWWKQTVCYEIYPNSFMDSDGNGTGDLKGITQKLPFLESLIAEANRHHIKIVMDLVFNHTSDQSEWFLESKKNKDNPKSDWYIWRDAKPDGSAPNNWRGIFGGSAWEWNEDRKQYYLHTFATALPDLNWANPNVRQALYDITNFWIDKGVGGFRIDAIPYIKKPAEMADGKGVFTVAEANGVGPDLLKYWVGDNGAFDMLFEFSHLSGADIWCSLPTMRRFLHTKESSLATTKTTQSPYS